ncbi:hypothetical protein CEXT_231231 [Caerostris extrusa]|uniref:Uncharacterized protein n=1 Tax=Caerostris extrusa TaxID=172846 RepID=A0AAV4RE38_CAEEX|nr:hypothetical protein CEXT_231231 [Caerostris extrusa]
MAIFQNISRPFVKLEKFCKQKVFLTYANIRIDISETMQGTIWPKTIHTKGTPHLQKKKKLQRVIEKERKGRDKKKIPSRISQKQKGKKNSQQKGKRMQNSWRQRDFKALEAVNAFSILFPFTKSSSGAEDSGESIDSGTVFVRENLRLTLMKGPKLLLQLQFLVLSFTKLSS